MAGELDQVSQAIGRIQGTLDGHSKAHDQILTKIDNLEKNMASKFSQYDEHIEQLNAEMQQRKGAKALLVAFAGMMGGAFVKILELVFK